MPYRRPLVVAKARHDDCLSERGRMMATERFLRVMGPGIVLMGESKGNMQQGQYT